MASVLWTKSSNASSPRCHRADPAVNLWIRLVWRIALLRAGPQDLPFSRGMAVTALGLLAAVLVAVRSFVPAPENAPDILPTVLVAVGSTALWPWIALKLKGKTERYAQATTAFAASSVLFVMMAVPFERLAAQWIPPGVPAEQLEPNAALAMISVAMLLLLVWKLRVDAHLWAQTLEIGRMHALLLTLALAVAEILLLNGLPASSAIPAP